MKNIFTRFVSVLFVLTITLSSAFAVPAKRGWQTATLQDGTGIEVQHCGDEFYHYWETRDGKIAVMQKDGTFVISDEAAPTGEQFAVRRNKSPRLVGQRRAKMDYGALQPTKLLVLLVNFSDKSMTSAHNNAFFQNLLNGAYPSVQDYFNQSSGGNYVPEFDVFGPYTLPKNMAYYGGNDSSGSDEHPDQMVVDACALAYADGCNFSNYDQNNDGKVDNIYVIYAGYGEAASDVDDQIWPHSWEIYSQYVSGTLTYNGKKLGHYACSAELSGKTGTNSDGVGTFAHEFSHVIGLPDYYDTEYGTNYKNRVTPGEWTLMDQGSYNGSGMYPPLYSVYDKYFMGWHTPALLAKDAKANVTLTTTWNDNYQITGGTSTLACTNTNTIYYIENRQKSGYDQYLPGHGMIVWKVTYNGSIWNDNKVNNTAGTLLYTIIPADGKTKSYGDDADPYPGTKSKTSYTPVTGCAMTGISESSGKISFKYNGGVSGHNVVVNGTGCTIEPSATIVANGTTLTATIAPTDDTYDFTSITVKLGTSNLAYTLSSDKKTLTINGSNITGADSNDITITVVWTKNRYKYEMLGENCTMPDDGTVNINAALNLTITPDAGYTLADAECWDVTMGNTQLTYGTGFTYNSSNNTFSVASVTGDVQIVAYGLHPVTWRANGNVHATNVAVDGKITLPDAPGDCESGKKFVGWCTSSSYEHATTAPTFAKTGDSYSVATYYAVYATASTSTGGSPVTVIERMSTSSPYVAQAGWTADAGGTYTSAGNYGDSSPSIKFNASDQYVQSATMTGAITAVSYWYKPQNATGSLNFYVSTDGTSFSELTAESVSFSSSSTADTKSITLSSSSNYRAIKIVYTKTTSNVAVDDISITYGGSSTTYSDYSTACGTPCSNTPSMSFANETVSKTTADASFTQAVTITGKGSGQTVAYSSSNEAVATVNGSTGAVTIQGVGSTTITASVAANGTYCSASASYTLTVTAAPINVTLYYNNTSATLSNRTNPYTLPTTGAYVAAMCDGDWTFDGWYGSTYDKSTTKPTYITELTATGSAYAVYKTTETTAASVTARKAEASSASYSFSNKSWQSEDGNWTSGKDGNGYVNNGVQVTTGTTGANATCPNSYDNISSIVVSYCTNANNGAGSIEMEVNGTTVSQTVSTTGGTTARNLTFDFSGTKPSGAPKITVTCSTNSIYVCGVTINYGSSTTSTTYYATTPECAVPVVCELTDITLNTNEAQTSFTIGGTFSSSNLVVTANYSNCESKVVTPASVSSPDMSSAGQKTVTVTYSEGETTVTATYTITVSAQYTVTWMACGSVFKTEQYSAGAALVLPSSVPENNTAGMSFAGWTTEEHYTGATAPTFITAGSAVNADATYYAIYH